MSKSCQENTCYMKIDKVCLSHPKAYSHTFSQAFIFNFNPLKLTICNTDEQVTNCTIFVIIILGLFLLLLFSYHNFP